MSRLTEQVVLLDDQARVCGHADKATVHTTSTPLHLAFSCWLLDGKRRTLLTRRAAGKTTWPSVWTNSFCGHPAPDEDVPDAVRRRAKQELGVVVDDLRLALPHFRYTARMDNGIVENEICPVFTASFTGELDADPAEVDSWKWVELASLPEAVAADPGAFSPWLLLQLPELLDQLSRQVR